MLGASNSVAFEVGSLAASLLLGGTRTDLRVCTDAGRVGGRIVGLETEIADGHALRKQVRVDFDRCAERWLRRMTGDAERVILRNGSTVVIRPLAAGDEAAIARWFAGLSAETRSTRFFGFLEQLDRRTESALARVDYFNHEAIAALAADGITVGIARCLRTGRRGSGEVAVAVADDWRGQASLASCSNGSQPGRVPSGSSHSP